MATKKVRHINLLPKEDFERTTLGRIMKWALGSFRFIVIVVEFMVIVGFLFRFYLDVQINNLDDEIQQKAALIDSKSSFEKEFRNTQKKLGFFEKITDPNNLSLASLKEVSGSVPSDIQIETFTKKGDILEITGATLNEASVAAFIDSLEGKQDKISSVELGTVSTQKESPLIEFSLKVSLVRAPTI